MDWIVDLSLVFAGLIELVLRVVLLAIMSLSILGLLAISLGDISIDSIIGVRSWKLLDKRMVK